MPLQNPWLAVVCIFFFAGTVSTFVSHTVASIILMPVISRIGVTLGIPEVVVVGSAFAGAFFLLIILNYIQLFSIILNYN